MRWAIFSLTLAAGIGMGGFGLKAFYLLVSAEFDVTDYWMLVARAAILALGGVGFFLYAMRSNGFETSTWTMSAQHDTTIATVTTLTEPALQ